ALSTGTNTSGTQAQSSRKAGSRTVLYNREHAAHSRPGSHESSTVPFSDTVGEITMRRQKPLILRIMVEQGRAMILFLSGLTPLCEQIFPDRCCCRLVLRI